MPFKKKSISHCIFKFTHVYLQVRLIFSFCAYVETFEDVCVIFSNSTEKKKKNMHIQISADDQSTCDELFRKKIHHAAPAVPVMFI